MNVVTHADSQIAWVLREGQWVKVSHRSLARFIRGADGYSGGPVRLLACDAGADARGLAQNLSNKLGVQVLGATDKVIVEGGSWSTAGSWRLFYPGAH